MSAYTKFISDRMQVGSLQLVHADGSREMFGSGEPQGTLRLNDSRTLLQIIKNPALQLGETYMEEQWDVPEGSLADLLRVLRLNFDVPTSSSATVQLLLSLVQSWNTVKSSFSNVSHHYDLDENLFRAFLDDDMHYSCAYFENDQASLEEAQQSKCSHIAKKLCLKPDAKVLDIGSGWGSLAMHLAEKHGANVTGITLSNEQLRVARQRASKRGLDNIVRFELEDYREHQGEYDAIVSVGMFEHVGKRNFRTFFLKLRELLRPRGVALLHTIGSLSEPEPTNAWIRKYIFPGGYIPTISEVTQEIEKSGLISSDIEIWRRHYASTLQEWNRRFQQVRDGFVKSHGERFCRMWEFYLVACQTVFEHGPLSVLQIQLAHNNDIVPLTRDYLYR